LLPLLLNSKERSGLDQLARGLDDPRALRRAQAVLWLDEEQSVAEVAERLQVSRQTIYNWAARLQARDGRGLAATLLDAPRSGRPPTVQGLIEPLLDAVIDEDPRDFGYQAAVWTAPLLRHYLQEGSQVIASRQSVSLALARLRVRCKRPRYVPARRSPTWRQAKGGSSAGCVRGSGRCS
jgi:transposase